MTRFQIIIKYLAIAFAVVLTVSIIGGILSIVGLVGFFGNNSAVAAQMQQYPVSGEVTRLELEIHAAELTIEESDSFFVKSNLKDLKVTSKNGTLVIQERDRLVKNYKGAALTVGIPKHFRFASAQIETGAGNVEIAALSADSLSLELGAGNVTIHKLHAEKSAELEGGAGKITILDGLVRNLQLDMGVGELNLTAALLGASELNLGVGTTNLTLLGTEADYTVRVEKGVGNTTVNGQSMSNNTTYGSGRNRVELEGGVGNILVNIREASMSAQ